MTDLAKKVVLSEHFELMDGMRLAHEGESYTVLNHEDGVGTWVYNMHGASTIVRLFGEWLDGYTLDISDPATKGCLLHLVRKAWGEPKMSVEWDECVGDDGTWCAGGPQYSIGESATEEETLCLALLAAPEKS